MLGPPSILPVVGPGTTFPPVSWFHYLRGALLSPPIDHLRDDAKRRRYDRASTPSRGFTQQYTKRRDPRQAKPWLYAQFQPLRVFAEYGTLPH